MFNSIRKRAIGLASKQAIASGADIVRRGLGVLMLLVTASVMLNLATPGAARAAPVDVAVSLSDYEIAVGETTIMSITITNNTGVDSTQIHVGTAYGSGIYHFPAGIVAGSPPIPANDCGSIFDQNVFGSYVAGKTGFHVYANLTAGASCTIQLTLKGTAAGVYTMPDVSLTMWPGAITGLGAFPSALTVVAPDPTPILTFATPTSASVAMGGSLTNAATSTITGGGAGAITYGSSNTGVATVNATTGAITTVAVGTTTITATQAATSGVNAAATRTYALTVTPAAPTVTGVSPNIGNGFQPGGFVGTTVVVTGTGFSVGTPSIYFGGLGAGTSTINSDTQITVTPPTGFHTGTVDVTVLTTNGTSATSSADQFTYAALPTISAVTPSSGPTSTSTPMTITGTGFTGATRVFVANGQVAFTVVSDTEITTTSPPVGVVFTGDVIVEGRGGWATATGGYSYVDPTAVLGVTMTHTGSAYKGATFAYVITPSATVANTSGALTAVWSLPSGLSVSSASGTGWACDSTLCTSTGAIGAGSNGNPITLTVSVSANATSPLAPSVTLSGGGATSSVTANDSGTTILTPAAPTIAVSTTSFPGAIAVGGTTQLTFTLTNPNPVRITGVVDFLSLPSGLVINQSSGGQFVNNCTNGSLSGSTGGASVSLTGAQINANSACTFTVVVRGTSAGSPVVSTGTPGATAASSGVAGASLTLTVNAALTTTQAVASVDLTQNVAVTAFTPVTASGGVGPLGYVLSGGSLPSGLSFSSSTGEITGTPAGLQSARTYTVTVIDASVPTALTSSKTFSLTVSAAPDPTPTLTFATPVSASVAYGDGLTNAATSTATGGGAGAITYSSSNTSVATVNATTGAITTVAVGTTTITATQAVAAGVNAAATQTYALTVTVGAGSTSSATLSASTVVVGETVDLTITVSNFSGVDVVAGDGVLLTASLAEGRVSYGLGAAISNTCGGSLTTSGVNGKGLTGIQAPNGATCTVVYRLTAIRASATPESIVVSLNPASSALNLATHTLPLTVTPPVPVLTFATPTEASVAMGGSLTNAVTSTITGGGAGEITYSSSNTDVATVNATTGAITTVAVRTTIITATQAATSGVNAAATQTYVLTVTPPVPVLTFATPTAAVVTLGGSLTNAATSTVSGGEAGAISYRSSDQAVATVDAVTGAITPVSVGTSTITAIQAPTRGVNTGATQTYQLEVTAPASPTIEGRTLPSWTLDSYDYSEVLVATGGLAPLTFTVNGGEFPDGLTLDAATGVISGTPTEPGGFSFGVQVTDGLGRSALGTFSITINPAITVTPETIVGAFVGQPYSQTFEASGGTGALVFAFKGELPEGLTFDYETGILSGTPTEIDTFRFAIISRDATGADGARRYNLVIGAGIPTTGAVTLPVTQGSVDNPVTLVLGGGTPTAIAIGAGPLHGVVEIDGLTMYYTPTAGYAGPDSFTYAASNAGGTSEPATVTVNVAATPFDFVTAELAGAVVGTAYSQAIEVAGGTRPLVFRISDGALAPGLTLSEAGVLSGTPTQSGLSRISIEVRDSSTGDGPFLIERLYSLRVDAPAIPTVAAVEFFVVYNAAATAAPISISGAMIDRVNLASSPAHGQVAIDGLTLTYTPEAGYFGPDSFTYTATNAGGTSAPATVSVTVGNPPPPDAEAVAVTVETDQSTDSTSIDLASAVRNATGIVIVTGPLHGDLTVDGFMVTYRLHPGYFGPDSFTYRAVGLPGSSASAAAGSLSGSSSIGAPFSPGLSASAAPQTLSSPATVSITVTPPTLVMSPTAAAPAEVGIAYSQAFTASGGTAPYGNYRVEDGALPAGLTLSADGQLTGTPTAGGLFTFTISATDSSTGSGPFTASRAYSFSVSAPTVALSPGSLANGVQGVAYGPVTFTGQGGTAPYSFSLAAGSLPGGLTLSSAGLLSGIPTQSGAFSFTVRATDTSTGAGPFTSERALSLVIDLPPAPTVLTASLASPYNSAGVDIDVATLVSGDYGAVAVTSGPAHGSVVRSGTRFTYTPATGYYGPDSFSYAATGPGGTSAPALVSVTVTAPAPVSTPKSATTLANTPVDVAVTTGDSGPISSITVTQAPSHGVTAINGLVVTYTPATNYFGADSFSYTATGAGGTSAPAVVSLTVSPLPVPTSPVRTVSVVSGQSVVLEATTGATGGPFTGVAMAGSPVAGTATVSGERITYAAPAEFSGSTSFTYTLSNPFGTSAPITVAVTVNPMPVTAAPITVVVPADGSGSALLTADATGGPFQSAAIVSQSPAGSGTVAITQGSGPSGPTFTLTYTAAVHFSGPVTVSYTLTNAFATSAPGTVVFQVQARADPTLDPDVRSLVAAQTDATLRFATTQMNNFNQRLESLRGGPGRSDLAGVNLNFGDLIHRGDQSDPFALRDRQLGRQDADVAPWGMRPASPAKAEKGFRAAGDGDAGGDEAGGVSLWTGGTIDMGLRRSRAGLSKLDFTTQGVSVGADFSLNDRVVIGGGTGYSSDSTTIGTNGSRSKATSYVGVLYGAYHPSDRTYLEMVVGYGEMAFESKRFVPVNSQLAYGERDGRQTFVSLTAAFEQRNGPLTWTPYGRVAVVSAELDPFTETGGGVGGLTFHRQDIRSVKGVAGLTSDYVTRTRYGLLTPALRLEYAYEFEVAGSYSLGYADWVGGPVFTASADALGRGRLTLGIGADLQRGPLLVGIEYRGGIGTEEATTSQVSAKMNLRF